jgi:MarR family transcriptional regulator, organic hydroperoxide resistance regulator
MTTAERTSGKNRPRKTTPSASPARDGTTADALGSALDFMRLLWAVDHGLQRRSKRMVRDLGVTGMQRIVIRLVGRYPEIAAGRLAELLHVHPSTLTGVLRRLGERGFLSREHDPQDRRRSRFVLLAPGHSVDSTQAGTVEAAVRRALARLPPEAVDSARVVLSAVADELARSDR